MGNFWIEDGHTALFIGDSITDCGRRGPEAPLGNGYVRMFADLATARYPERRIRYINKGIGGNRIVDLKERWQDDVLYHRPDRLSIKIGINDLHTYLNDPNTGVSPELFADTYVHLLERTRRELGCPVVLIAPFYISTDRSGQTFRSRVMDLIPRYVEITAKMSAEYKTRLVNLHAIFQGHLGHREADTFCPEPVHPSATGHLVIAQALLDELER
jgi:lysophospholipase L1-like esterase